MTLISRVVRRLFAVLVVLCAVPSLAAAQQRDPLKIPTIAAGAAAAADWVSTYHSLKNYHVRETNPLLRTFDAPGSIVSAGALMDAGAFTAWNLTVGRKNERLAVAGLWAMAAFRSYLVVHNIRTARRAVRR